MAWFIHYVTREAILDHVKRCERCGAVFNVVDRAYAMGSGSTAHRAERAAQKEMQKAAKNRRSWHRCIRCGRYNEEDLQLLKQHYRTYRRRMLVARWICWGCALIPFMWIVVLPSLILFIVGWGIARGLPREFEANEPNGPYRTPGWLEDWQANSPQLVTACLSRADSLLERQSAWGKLDRLQHGYDFGPIRRKRRAAKSSTIDI